MAEQKLAVRHAKIARKVAEELGPGPGEQYLALSAGEHARAHHLHHHRGGGSPHTVAQSVLTAASSPSDHGVGGNAGTAAAVAQQLVAAGAPRARADASAAALTPYDVLRGAHEVASSGSPTAVDASARELLQTREQQQQHQQPPSSAFPRRKRSANAPPGAGLVPPEVAWDASSAQQAQHLQPQPQHFQQEREPHPLQRQPQSTLPEGEGGEQYPPPHLHFGREPLSGPSSGPSSQHPTPAEPPPTAASDPLLRSGSSSTTTQGTPETQATEEAAGEMAAGALEPLQLDQELGGPAAPAGGTGDSGSVYSIDGHEQVPHARTASVDATLEDHEGDGHPASLSRQETMQAEQFQPEEQQQPRYPEDISQQQQQHLQQHSQSPSGEEHSPVSPPPFSRFDEFHAPLLSAVSQLPALLPVPPSAVLPDGRELQLAGTPQVPVLGSIIAGLQQTTRALWLQRPDGVIDPAGPVSASLIATAEDLALYDPAEGLHLFFDFVTGLTGRAARVQVAYCFYLGDLPVGTVQALGPQDTERDSDASVSVVSSSGNGSGTTIAAPGAGRRHDMRAMFASQRMVDGEAADDFTLVIEVQRVTGPAPSDLRSIAWTAVPMFRALPSAPSDHQQQLQQQRQQLEYPESSAGSQTPLSPEAAPALLASTAPPAPGLSGASPPLYALFGSHLRLPLFKPPVGAGGISLSALRACAPMEAAFFLRMMTPAQVAACVDAGLATLENTPLLQELHEALCGVAMADPDVLGQPSLEDARAMSQQAAAAAIELQQLAGALDGRGGGRPATEADVVVAMASLAPDFAQADLYQSPFEILAPPGAPSHQQQHQQQDPELPPPVQAGAGGGFFPSQSAHESDEALPAPRLSDPPQMRVSPGLSQRAPAPHQQRDEDAATSAPSLDLTGPPMLESPLHTSPGGTQPGPGPITSVDPAPPVPMNTPSLGPMAHPQHLLFGRGGGLAGRLDDLSPLDYLPPVDEVATEGASSAHATPMPAPSSQASGDAGSPTPLVLPSQSPLMELPLPPQLLGAGVLPPPIDTTGLSPVDSEAGPLSPVGLQLVSCSVDPDRWLAAPLKAPCRLRVSVRVSHPLSPRAASPSGDRAGDLPLSLGLGVGSPDDSLDQSARAASPATVASDSRGSWLHSTFDLPAARPSYEPSVYSWPPRVHTTRVPMSSPPVASIPALPLAIPCDPSGSFAALPEPLKDRDGRPHALMPPALHPGHITLRFSVVADEQPPGADAPAINHNNNTTASSTSSFSSGSSPGGLTVLSASINLYQVLAAFNATLRSRRKAQG